MKASPMYRFAGSDGRFHSDNAAKLGSVYFPIANELGLLSAVTPDLAGDIKLDQHAFFSLPTAFEDLHLSRSTRNFWLAFKSPKAQPWSVSGRSVISIGGTRPSRISATRSSASLSEPT